MNQTLQKKLITTPSLVLVFGAVCCLTGAPRALENYEASRTQTLQKQAETEQIEAKQQLALDRIKSNCTIAHDVKTGLPSNSVNIGSPFHNIDGYPVPINTVVCAKDGSTALVLYSGGVPRLFDLAKVHMDQKPEYDSYYNQY